MRRVIWRRECERGLGRMIQRGKNREKFLDIVALLGNDGRVPIRHRPHKLSGEWEGHWECHIESDWLLIYNVTDKEVLLARTGTHADLFG